MKTVAILSGYAWNNPQVDFIKVAEDIDLAAENKEYKKWHRESFDGRGMRKYAYLTFVEWLLANKKAEYSDKVETYEEI